ncbi:MAG: hypothetical protein ABEJ93_02515 [Candidatus Nanohalobium sp.]
MKVTKGKTVLAALALLFFIGFSSSTVVVNSQDWKDVHSGMQYADFINETPHVVTSSGAEELFKVLPKNEEVTVLQSETQPYVANLESQLTARGYKVEEVIQIENGNQELIPEGTENFVVVQEGNPAASLAAAPLANNMNGWVLIANPENIDSVKNIVEDAENVVMVGTFTREVRQALEQLADETIIDPNKFKLSTKVAERIEEERKVEKVMLADGSFLERDIITTKSPVLLSGTNLLPESIQNYILGNQDIGSVYIIGSQLTTVGETLKDKLKDENRNTSVFVKYGQGRRDTGIRPLSFFDLPTGDVELRIDSAEYDPQQEKLYVTFTNLGSANMYELTSFTVKSNGKTVASGGDEEPKFIGPNSSITVGYDVELSVEQAKNGEVEFTTSYGERPSNLDTYVTSQEEGVFGPPYTLEISVANISDRSRLQVKKIVYLKGVERFKVVVENTGNVTAYATANILNVTVKGQEKSFSTDRKKVKPGQKLQLYAAASLDRIDLQQNKKITAEIRYGERENQLLKSKEVTRDFKSRSGSIAGMFASSPTAAGAVILIILAAAGIYMYRKKGLELDIDLNRGSEDEDEEEFDGDFTFK